MAFADVINPVKIKLSSDLVAVIDNYLRRMCIVSAGDSNIEVGSYAVVTASDYNSYLMNSNNNSELKNKLTTFFTFSRGKSCIVLETGAPSNTNTISTQVGVLEDFIKSGISRCYMHLVPDAWYWPDQKEVPVDSSKPALKVSPTTITLAANAEPYVLSLNTNATSVTATLENGATDYFEFDSTLLRIIPKQESNGTPYTITVSAEVGGETLTTTISVTIAADDTPTEVAGAYSEGYSLQRDMGFIRLATQFNQVDNTTYFIVKSDSMDPTISPAWESYSGNKSLFVVFDNSLMRDSTQPLSAVFLGIMANAIYDISDTQRGTPLNNKVVNGIKTRNLGNVLANNVIQAPQNFAGQFAGNTVLFNGRNADGKTWDYHYQADLTMYRIQEALQGLLLNSSNNGNYTLQYNQNGIDVITATIKSVLNVQKERGIITEFGVGVNPATGALIMPGYINAVDFYTYKNANPQDYANGIYGGISFYALIAGYIQQINLDITIG